jgi:hypothetical protein
VRKLKQQHNTKLSTWAQDFLDQLQELDKESTTFRYGENPHADELWIDLHQLEMIVGVLCDELEKLIYESYAHRPGLKNVK